MVEKKDRKRDRCGERVRDGRDKDGKRDRSLRERKMGRKRVRGEKEKKIHGILSCRASLRRTE